MPIACRVALALVLMLASFASAQVVPALRQTVSSPVGPAESLKLFQLPEDLRIELVASEPQVVDPVAVRFDEHARLWVVEMSDYPTPITGSSLVSRIKLLEDLDRDGHYETSHLFADDLRFATGLQPWRGGVIVTVSGKVLYLKDNDGDLRADQIDQWFTGFSEENSQLRANHPRFALDNNIYIANGLRGGNVISMQAPEEPLSISSRDFRFNPLNGSMNAVSGVGQFGMTFDDFGNRFNCSNRNPLRHVVFEDRYLQDIKIPVADTSHDVAAPGEASKVFPITDAWTTSNLHAGQFTAACGVEIYRGHLLPDRYAGAAFTCEPTGSLVHAEALKPAGATFTSQPIEPGREFLASPDSWFRPVNLELGPDGALYVVDMYRAVIEHPEWMPEELQKRPDLRDGSDRGRIYRIVPASRLAQEPAPVATLPSTEMLATDDLIELLQHENAWQRETAARLLYERQDKAARDRLEELVRISPSPAARVHALFALSGQDLLSDEILAAGLRDKDPKVQAAAAQLAEERLVHVESLRLLVAKLSESSDPRTRFQAALSLADVNVDVRIPALAAIAMASLDDPWTRNAVCISAGNDAHLLLASLLNGDRLLDTDQLSGGLQLASNLGQAAAASNDAAQGALRSVLETLDTDAATRLKFHVLTGIAQGLARRGLTPAAINSDVNQRLQSIFIQAAAIAADASKSDPLRFEGISVIRFADADFAVHTLKGLLDDSSSDTLQSAVVTALSAIDHADIGPVLVASFDAQSPAVRRTIIDSMLEPQPRVELLLTKLESGEIALPEVDPARRERLRTHRLPGVREKAIALFSTTTTADRTALIQSYAPLLNSDVDAHRGRSIFQKNCATCHRIGTLGIDVGPDISDSRVKTAEQILQDILVPNQAIDSNYIGYSAVTTDGVVHTGLLMTETAGSVTLKTAEGKQITLLRDEIEELRSTGLSLMPEGFEAAIPPKDMADLVAYIKNWRYLPEEAGAATSR